MKRIEADFDTIISSNGPMNMDTRVQEIPRPLLEFLVQSFADGVVIMGEASQIQYVNDAAASIFGYEVSEMIGESLTMIMPPELREMHNHGIRRYQETRKPTMNWSGATLPALHRDGSAMTVQIWFSALEAEEGLTFMGLIKDITATLKVEKELEDEKQRFKAFFNRTHEPMFIHDTNGVVIDANQSALEALGRTREELIGIRVSTLHAAGQVNRPPNPHLEVGAGFTFKTNLLHSDGATLLPVEVKIQKIRFDGQLVLIAAMRDLTQVERLKEQLQRSQQMELVGRLAGGISHDFNNLLAVIMSNAYELSSNAMLAPTEKQIVADIILASEQAAALTSRLLGMARSTDAQRNPMNINTLIQDMHRVFLGLLGANITLMLELDDALEDSLINESQINQILTNLVVNARDAIVGQGTVWIRTTHGTAQDPSLTVFEVQDTGHGMSEEILQRIFEPHISTKELGAGTGLGLSSVQSILDAHGASIEVESVVGQGSIFRISLPAHKSMTPNRVPRLMSEDRSIRVLIVEDMKPLRETLVRLLKRKQFLVESCSDGEEAMKILHANPVGYFNLVITDMMMPRMNGRELCDAVNREQPSLPVIVLSAYSADLAPESAPGHVGFLAKPVQPKRLFKMMDRLLAEIVESEDGDAQDASK